MYDGRNRSQRSNGWKDKMQNEDFISFSTKRTNHFRYNEHKIWDTLVPGMGYLQWDFRQFCVGHRELGIVCWGLGTRQWA